VQFDGVDPARLARHKQHVLGIDRLLQALAEGQQ
jgi:hypothetical protein